MKTLTILFESPNVFYAVIDGVNIRIDNPEILPVITNECDLCDGCGWYEGGPTLKTDCNACKASGILQFHNHKKLITGDIFQVEGFELTKEEEPKEPTKTDIWNKAFYEGYHCAKDELKGVSSIGVCDIRRNEFFEKLKK